MNRTCGRLLRTGLATSLTLLGLFGTRPATGATYYVDAYSTATNLTGNSWAEAYTNIQDALSLALDGDAIWVAQGSYVADSSNTMASFQLKPNVRLYGGLTGIETNVVETRPWQFRHPTTLDGDIGTRGNVRDNTRQVVKALFATNAVLDGFRIVAGNGSTNHVLYVNPNP